MVFFSIIIPTLNAGRTLEKTLQSVLAQTFSSYEIILQDGGSQDETLPIAARFVSRFQGRLRIIENKDAGVYDAMNQALLTAKGRWFYFLGGDDLLHDDAVLQNVATAIRSKPYCQIVYGDVVLLSTQSRYDGPFLPLQLLKKNICHQALFYRREVFRLIGNYNLAYRSWADWDLNVRCFFSGKLEIHYLDLVIAIYNDLSGFSHDHMDIELFETIKLFADQKITKPRRSVWATLRRKWENWLDR